MAQYPDKKIILLMGTLGSGKGTQADKLAGAFGLHHFDTGPFLKELLGSDDPGVAKEKAEYESGKWVSPEFVAGQVLKKISEIIPNYNGLVFSGSPRTLYEAEQELPVFEDFVGKGNIKIFYLNLSEAESLKRSMGRLICEKNKHPVPNLPEFQEIRKKGVCPEDGSRLIKKELDDPEILKSRLNEHNNRTLPVIDYLKQRGHEVTEINGEQPIEKVFEDISKYLLER
jgi:adenylate kinase